MNSGVFFFREIEPSLKIRLVVFFCAQANIEKNEFENAEVGLSLETFRATDPDQGGKSRVSYAIDRSSDRRRQFAITQNGTVYIQRQLDREDTPRHQVRVLLQDAEGCSQRRSRFNYLVTFTLTTYLLDLE